MVNALPLWMGIVWQKIGLVVVLIAAIGYTVAAPMRDTYRVFFRDKGISPFIPGSELYQATKNLISPKAIQRRAKVLSSDSLLLYSDAPLYKPYLTDIERSGARILLQLRWRNYIVVECDSATAAFLRTKPYVQAVTPTADVLRPQQKRISYLYTDGVPSFQYGVSYQQLEMLRVPELHQIGITGSGVVVGFIDTGFRWREHTALERAKVLAEYDFIAGDSVTANQDGDPVNQDAHGTAVMSVVAGNYPDSLIGVAPCAEFILAKTENIASERRIEEDAFAAAVEWMEALGVDVINASLGYDNFDSTEVPYASADFDGNTTIVAWAVNQAVRRGVVCVVAAGNNGDTPGTISSPGDSDSAITVGAFANAALDIPRFTSRGPTFDGRLKPNVAALGVNVRTASPITPLGFGYSSGTSLATPLVAGCVALLLQAYPELTPSIIRTLLQESGSHANEPNYAVGYGLPNVVNSALRWNILCSPPVAIPRGDSILLGILALSEQPHVTVELTVQQGSNIRQIATTRTGSFYAALVPFNGIDSLAYSYLLSDGLRTRRYPSSGHFYIRRGDTTIPCGWQLQQILFAAFQNTHSSSVRSLAIPLTLPIMPLEPRFVAARYTVYDLSLRTQGHGLLPPLARTLDLSWLIQGIYFIRVEYEDGVHYSQLIMVY